MPRSCRLKRGSRLNRPSASRRRAQTPVFAGSWHVSLHPRGHCASPSFLRQPTGSQPPKYQFSHWRSGDMVTMPSRPAITVTIPIYNGERYLAETIQSLMAQTFCDFQVIIVDDCSSDGSHALVRKYTEGDSRFVLIRTPKNQGSASKVINFALPHAVGDYFAYSSQDDLYSTDWLSEMYRTARKSGAEATLPKMVFYRAGAEGELAGIRGAGAVWPPSISGREAVTLSLDWKVHGFALWKTELVRATRFKEFGIFADEYTVRELFMACKTVAFSGGTFFYRQDNPEA